MKTAHLAFRKILLVSFLGAALVFPKDTWAAAGAAVTCNSGATCTIGEFLYNDSYLPDSSASCVINSLYPDASTSFLNIGVTSPADVGWYSYSFTAPTTTGYYRTQICCTSGEDYLCLDKSFEVATEAATALSTDEIAQAVWGYSTRTMSGFGSLASDIWGYSSRTMSGFGNLISDLWGHSSRTLTGTQATNITNITNNVTSIEKTVTEIQTQLEQVVNKPVIQNFLEDVPDLGAKINETKTTADMLFMNSQYVISRVGLLELKWKTLTDGELLENVVGLGNVLGEETDSSSTESIFGQLAWLKSSWTWPLVEEVFDQTKAVKATLTSLETKLVAEGKSSSTKKELSDLNYYLVMLEKLIGDSTDISGQKTLFSKLKEVRELAGVFDSRETEVNELLTNWKSQGNKDIQNDIQDKIDTLFKKIIAVNRIPQARAAFTPKGTGSSLEKLLKNRLLGLRALIAANRLLLAKGAGAPLANTWLEEGSIVFKSLVTNPSKIISQKVTLKYYLPAEVKKENIIEVDEGLTVNFDADKNQYYVEGEFNLRAGETQTVAVKVADIWNLPKDEIDSLRKQAEELSRPLEKTPFFAQGVTLKSDIDVSLDKILVLHEGKVTPEEKIRAYREAQIELGAVKTKMDKLKELVTQAGSSGNLLGFVGGSQTMAVWGLIIILLAGFVFLAIYMRVLTNGNNRSQELKDSETEKKPDGEEGAKGQVKERVRGRQVVKMAFLLLAFGSLTAVISGVIVWKMTLTSLAAKKSEFTQQASEVQGLAVEKPAERGKVEEEKKEELIKIAVPVGEVVNVRNGPNLSSQILIKLRSSQDAQKLEVLDEWVKVSLPDKEDPEASLIGWVNDDFVSSD